MLISSLSFFMQCSMPLDKMADLSLEQTVDRVELREIKGVSLTTPTYSIWDQVWKFKARPDDLLISTYAKAGLCGEETEQKRL